MKKFLFAAFLSSGFFLFAQKPAIHSHTILPAYPYSNSDIKIVTHLETMNAAFQVDKQFTVSATSKIIRLYLCYSEGMATVITHHIDTFAVGQLSQGVYSIQLSAYMSSAGQHCARIDSNFTSTTFTVSEVVGKHETAGKSKVRVFPNPASDFITVKSDGQRTIRIFSLQGQLIRAAEIPSTGLLTLQGLFTGMYLLEVVTPEGKEVHRIVIQ